MILYKIYGIFDCICYFELFFAEIFGIIDRAGISANIINITFGFSLFIISTRILIIYFQREQIKLFFERN